MRSQGSLKQILEDKKANKDLSLTNMTKSYEDNVTTAKNQSSVQLKSKQFTFDEATGNTNNLPTNIISK